MNPETYHIDPKSPLVCPSCGEKILNAAGVTPQHSNTVRKGGIYICAACQAPSVVGDSNLEALTEDRFKLLDKRVQMAVQGIVRTLRDTIGQNTEGN